MAVNSTISLAILGSRGIPARYGGFETFAEELAIRLAAQGVEVTVYCEQESDSDQPEIYHGVKLAYLPAPICGPLTTILFDLRCLWHARKSYDVVYMLGYGAAQFCFIPRIWGSRVWLNVDGIEWARSKWSCLARLYFKLMEFFSIVTPNLVIADAFAIKDHLQRRHTRHTPISVIPYGAPVIDSPPETSVLDEWKLAPGGYYLIVCRLEPENHVLEILEGFAASTSNRTIVVIGNHQSGTEYVEQLLRISDSRIRFIGTLFDKKKLQSLRYNCFAYCHGHSVGGTNPSLLEAMGCGNAIIAHDNPFNREVAGEAAIYFNSVNDCTDCFIRMENGRVNRDTMKSFGIESLKMRYSWEQVTAAYRELLR